MILSKLFQRKPDPAQTLYEAIVAAARQPKFYADWGVPDTVDGRFEMVSLHMFLVLERLKTGATGDQRQALIDTFFKDMDRSLREMGTGDLSVSKKIRKMAEAFYGRVKAFDAAKNEGELSIAIARNLYPETPDKDASQLAGYVVAARAKLAEQVSEKLLDAEIIWP